MASKRTPDILRYIFDDLEANCRENETFNDYYDRVGKDYFYQLLKPLADNTTLSEDDYIDWGSDHTFSTAIGVGECAGVVIDLVATLFMESEEKLQLADETLSKGRFGDSAYYSYAAFINTAKTILLVKDIKTNTHHGVISEFAEHFSSEESWVDEPFRDLVLQINKQIPDALFAAEYLNKAKDFYQGAQNYRIQLNQKAAV